jgi:hypothetical protein
MISYGCNIARPAVLEKTYEAATAPQLCSIYVHTMLGIVSSKFNGVKRYPLSAFQNLTALNINR